MPDASTLQGLLQGIRVLVTDDEPEMREVFATWLANLGCEVEEAGDGAEALDKLKHTNVDVVITDVRMPRLDGVGLAKHLANSLEYTPIVIFVSGFHDLPTSEAHDLGIETILSKPCPRKQLVQAVQASLLRRQLQFFPAASTAGPFKSMRRCFAESFENAGVAIGRGGFSLFWDSGLAPDLPVEYNLRFAAGPLRILEGSGITRWTESVPGSNRVGVEFTQLSDSCRAELLCLLEQAHPHSFIPRDCHSAHAASTS